MISRLLSVPCIALLLFSAGCKKSSTTTGTFGPYTLTVVHGPAKPHGGTTGTEVMIDDTEVHTYESANGEYKVKLKNDILTVNGEKYRVDKPGSNIRLEGDKVMINGTVVTPEDIK